MDGTQEYSKSITDEEIISQAKDLWKDINDFESEVRAEMKDDIRFEDLQQWDDDVVRFRGDRPSLVIPRLNQFLNQVRNDQRQNKPSIKVIPKGADSDVIEQKRIKAAERRQGLIRTIQYQSRATQAYQNAFDYATGPGRGFFRIITEYISGKSFDQKICIDLIKNPLNVYMSRFRKEMDYSDCKYGFILDKMSKAIFQKEHPNASAANWEGGDENDDWVEKDDVIIAEFYCTWVIKRELYRLKDGMVGYMDEIGKDMPEESRAEFEAAIESKRTVSEPKIMWYKMTAAEILDRKEIPGQYIPIIPVIGVEKDVDGKLSIFGMTRQGKDSSKMYNFWASTEAEFLTTAPKAKYMGAKGQFEGYEADYEQIHLDPSGYAVYNPVSHNGQLVPPPQLQMPPPIPSGIVNGKLGALDDLKGSLGMFDASMGAQGNETSGRAIIARQREGDTSNYHFIDNMGIALTQAGKIINEWLDTYYDGSRIEMILGEDGEPKQLNLGGMDENQEEVTLGDPDVDVVVQMGPSVSTKRQESMEFLMELVKSFPNVTPLIYDLLVKNIDSPGAQEIADRLKKTIPPEILEEQGGEKQMRQELQQATQQLQQSQMVMQEMQQQIEQLMQEQQAKQMELQAESMEGDKNRSVDLASERIKSDTQLEVARIKAGAEQAKIDSQYRIEQAKGILDFKKAMFTNLNKPQKETTNA